MKKKDRKAAKIYWYFYFKNAMWLCWQSIMNLGEAAEKVSDALNRLAETHGEQHD